MNEYTFRILGLHQKIDRNKNASTKLRIIAVACLFFSSCYCFGTKTIGDIDKAQAIITNLVWIVSLLILIGFYLKDSYNIKNNKQIEFDIYRLELEELINKIETAKITGAILPDYILNKKVNMPDEYVVLPNLYYGILIVIHIIVRISLRHIL